jgi:phosphotransferase system enzyme I (PtsI)
MSVRESSGERIFQGIPVSPGIAHGRILVLGRRDTDIPQRAIEESGISAEINRFHAALASTRHDLERVQDQVRNVMGAAEAGLFDAHLLVLEDPTLLAEVARHVRQDRCNVEWVLHQVAERYASALAAVEDEYLRERAADIRDVAGRVIDHLLGIFGEQDLAHLKEPCIVIAHDLAPSTTAQLDRTKVLGFATETGGQTSHTAILARKLKIPAAVGLPEITQRARSGKFCLLDGHSGTLTLDPSDQTLFEYGQLSQRRVALEDSLETLRCQPAVTLDGHRLILSANIDHPDDAVSVRNSGAEGVGLFRTEFLFMNRGELPDEEEQYRVYRSVVEALAPEPVIIRTLDLGGDKLPSSMAHPGELNPFLGWRAIRISLSEPTTFRSQLKAILRAGAHGHVRVMYPMISSVDEVRAANTHLAEVRAELLERGVSIADKLEVGAMIEIPGAALVAGALAKEVDFFSLGTNDLTGYTLAVDRLNERVASLFCSSHPAVLRLIQMTVEAGHHSNRWVGVCGEMAGDISMVPALVGLGVDELSVTPAAIPQVKYLIRRLRRDTLQVLASELLQCDTAQEVLRRSLNAARQAAPALF